MLSSSRLEKLRGVYLDPKALAAGAEDIEWYTDEMMLARERLRHEQRAYEKGEEAKIRHMYSKPCDLSEPPQQYFAAHPSLTSALLMDSSMLRATFWG